MSPTRLAPEPVAEDLFRDCFPTCLASRHAPRAEADTASLVEVTERILEASGGRLQEGYRLS